MDNASLRCVHLAARVVPERQFNQMLDATRNKGSALFSTAVVHLDHLIRAYGEKGLVIFCDRQGGREHYGALLRLMFEDWSLEVTRELDGHSEYSSYAAHTSSASSSAKRPRRSACPWRWRRCSANTCARR
jgi:hypothetical protein